MSTPGSRPANAPGHDTRSQRFGHVTGQPPPAAGPGAHAGTCLVRDDETGITYSFGYTDIVTEGLRTIRAGERVRFLIDRTCPGTPATSSASTCQTSESSTNDQQPPVTSSHPAPGQQARTATATPAAPAVITAGWPGRR